MLTSTGGLAALSLRAPAASSRARPAARRATSPCAPRSPRSPRACPAARDRRAPRELSRAACGCGRRARSRPPRVRPRRAAARSGHCNRARRAAPAGRARRANAEHGDDTRSPLLPRDADARVRLTAGRARGRALLAQTHSVLGACVAAPAVPPPTHALPVPEPTLQSQPKAEALEAHLLSPLFTPRHRHTALSAAEAPFAHVHSARAQTAAARATPASSSRGRPCISRRRRASSPA
jgi:hypothetical protein